MTTDRPGERGVGTHRLQGRQAAGAPGPRSRQPGAAASAVELRRVMLGGRASKPADRARAAEGNLSTTHADDRVAGRGPEVAQVPRPVTSRHSSAPSPRPGSCGTQRPRRPARFIGSTSTAPRSRHSRGRALTRSRPAQAAGSARNRHHGGSIAGANALVG